MTCHLGDFTEYSRLRRELSAMRRMRRRAAHRGPASPSPRTPWHGSCPGDVVDVPTGRAPGYAVVLRSDPNSREPRPAVLTVDNQLRRIGTPGPRRSHHPRHPGPDPEVVQRKGAQVPQGPGVRPSGMPSAKTVRRRRASNRNTDFGRSAALPDQEKRITELRRALRSHPCHGCSEREDHARWSERWWKLRRETDGLVREIQGRTNTIAKTFDRVCDVLSSYGYLETSESGKVTISADGQKLRRIYGEKDLLISQSLRQGAFNDLDADGSGRTGERAGLPGQAGGTRPAPQDAQRVARDRRGHRGPGVVGAGGRRGGEQAAADRASRSSDSSGRSSSGPRAGTSRKSSAAPTWQPATSSAGSSRSSTCWTSWPRSPAWTPVFPGCARKPSFWSAAASSRTPPWFDRHPVTPHTKYPA